MDRQGVLLEGAVRAGVPRFIPSDYSADFTKTRPGGNRNPLQRIGLWLARRQLRRIREQRTAPHA